MDIRRETYDKGCGALMGSRSDDDDRTIQFPHAVTAQPAAYDRLTNDAPISDEKPTVIAASPSQSMLQVADPTEPPSSPLPPSPQIVPAHPADDEPSTMVTKAPELMSEPVLPAEPAAEPVPARMPESRPRLPTPRMDLRSYTPASIGPTALTLAPPPEASPRIPRTPFPFPRFGEDFVAPELGSPPKRESRIHPVAWIAVGVVLGAGAMAAIMQLRGSAAPASANVPAETELDKIAPMPSAAPNGARAPH